MQTLRIFLASAALLLLAACETTTYDFRPPHTDQGRMCVTQCAGIKEVCRANEMQTAQRNKESCERTKDVSLRGCLAAAKTKEEQNNCNKERQRHSCYAQDTTQRCESGYRSCFRNCGGTIIETTK